MLQLFSYVDIEKVFVRHVCAYTICQALTLCGNVFEIFSNFSSILSDEF